MGFSAYLWWFARFKIYTLRWDKKEEGFFVFLKQIEQDGTLLDVGANIGVMTYHMATAFPRSQVISIEPVMENSRTLVRVVKKYKLSNVEVVESAVGEKEGAVELVMPTEGRVRMHGLAHVADETSGAGKRYSVKMQTIDSLLNEPGRQPVRGIKIDIENYEYEALLGARSTLEKDQPVLYVELWDNENRTNCFNLLGELGYKAYTAKNGELIYCEDGRIDSQYFIFAPALK